ncbi:MAG: nucleotide exchange factor GrpE [Actinomycetota bacterium]|nr:nucleotide exchange factor GrpE [Actinomycetota bacterium]
MTDPAREQLDELLEREEAPADEAASAEDDLQARLAAAEAKAAEHLDHLQRLAAEFDNYRKRAARDQETVLALANERLVKQLLPVLDDLERALEAAAAHEEAKLEEGVALVARSFRDVLEKEGLKEVPTDGRFDPHVHEALLSQPSDEDEGTVIEVLQKGYRLGDRVLRPARVVVAASKQLEATEDAERGDGE